MTALDRIYAQRAILAARRGDEDALRELMGRAPDAVTAALKEHEPARAFLMCDAGVGRWGAAEWQRRCLRDRSGRKLIRGGNKVGKSLEIAEECALYFDGAHPVWGLPKGEPGRILYVVADMANAYADDVCRTLREVLPESKWGEGVKYSSLKGFTVSGRRGFVHKDGHEIIFRSGTQDGQAIAGLWADIVVINEPPMQSRWGEIMRAAALRNAPVLAGFTPVDNHGVSRDLLWLRDVVEAPDSDWSQHVVRLTPENVPHRRPEDVEQQIKDMLPWEIAQRRDAAWEGPAPYRRLDCFDPTRHVFYAAPMEWGKLPAFNGNASALRFGIAADHGERENKEVVILYAWAGSGEDLRCWILDNYLSPGATGYTQDAESVVRMLARWGLTPDHVDIAIGDTNSSGKGDITAATVNEGFTNAFKALGYRLRMVPADKGAGSIGMGVHVLNDAFSLDRLFICAEADAIKTASERWEGKNDRHKDKIDPVRYGPGALFKEWRDTKRARVTPAMPEVDTPWFDGDMWDGSGGF